MLVDIKQDNLLFSLFLYKIIEHVLPNNLCMLIVNKYKYIHINSLKCTDPEISKENKLWI